MERQTFAGAYRRVVRWPAGLEQGQLITARTRQPTATVQCILRPVSQAVKESWASTAVECLQVAFIPGDLGQRM